MWKQIVVLANSVKHEPGRCIAGREIVTKNGQISIGTWVRPVTRIGEGELYPRHFILGDGSIPQIFDVIEVCVDVLGSDMTQPENWIIIEGPTWERIHRYNINIIMSYFVENPPNLWLEHHVKTDRVTKEFLATNPPQQSLYLLELHNAVITGFGRRFRLNFVHNSTNYNLAITDPLITNMMAGQPTSIIYKGLACISLAPAFYNQYDGKEYHYKLAAMVIRHE